MKTLSYTFLAILISVVLHNPIGDINRITSTALFTQKDTPDRLCQKGRELFEDGRYSEALIFLEEGFVNRNEYEHFDENELGMCALALGILWQNEMEYDNAIMAFTVASDQFEKISELYYFGVSQYYIGATYYQLQEYQFALLHFQTSLDIVREIGDVHSESLLLNNIAAVYSDLSNYDDALINLQEALRITRETGDQLEEGNTIINIATVYYNQGDFNQALQYYNNGLAIYQDLGYLQEEINILEDISDTYYLLGEYDKSIDALERALEVLSHGNDYNREVAILFDIANMYTEIFEFEQGIRHFNTALNKTRDIGDTYNEALVLNRMSVSYFHMGDFENSLLYASQALEISIETKDRPREAYVLGIIGTIYLAKGQYGQALEYLQQSYELSEEIGFYDGMSTGLNNIAGVYAQLGHFDFTIDYLEQALDINRLLQDKYKEAVTLNNIGETYQYLGEYQFAISYFEKANEVIQVTGDIYSESTVQNNLGLSYLELGESGQALEAFNNALQLAEKTRNEYGIGSILNNIGLAYLNLEDYEEALTYFKRSLVFREKFQDLSGKSITLFNIGTVYEYQDDYINAIKYYELAIEVLETIRISAGNDINRTEYISQYRLFYDRLLAIYFHEGYVEQAFFTSERGRARAFLDSLSSGYVEFWDDKSEELFLEEQAAYAFLETIKEELNIAISEDPQDVQRIATLELKLEEANKDYQVVLDDIKELGGQTAQFFPGVGTIVDVQQAQSMIDDNSTLLSFWVLDEETIIFIITEESFDTVSLPINKADISLHIESFLTFSNNTIHHPQSAVQLYDLIIEPLLPHLNTSNLIIIPHGKLHYLPFAALTDGSEYLIDNFTISYLPSVSTWPYIRENAQEIGGEPLVLGNPSTNLFPLPFAEREARSVASLLGTKPLLEENATESALSQNSPNISILHLAAHGEYNSINPLYSALYLTGDDQADGILEVHEIYNLDLSKSEMVVLSACESQLGNLTNGDEFLGLTRAFFFAGTPRVMASLWEVDDEATQLLMISFYSFLQRGSNPAEALRQAQIEIRNEFPNPYYWGAFVISGDINYSQLDSLQVSSKSEVSFFQYFSLFIILVFIVALFILTRKLSKKIKTNQLNNLG
jgi:CHAT domain-containing protein/Tfp pilus assembly protein PilF